MRLFPEYLRELISEHKPALIGVALILVLDAIGTLAIPILGAKFGSQLLAAHPENLISLAVLLSALILLQAVFRYFSGLKMAEVGIRLHARLNQRLHAHLMAIPVHRLQAQPRGDRLSLFSQDSPQISQFVTQTLVTSPIQLMTLGVAVTMMMNIAWHFTLILLACLALAVVAIRYIGKQIQPHSQLSSKREAKALGMVEEDLHQLEWLAAQGMTSFAHDRYDAQMQKLVDSKRNMQRWMTLFGPVLNIGLAIALILIAFTISHDSDAQPWTNEALLQLVLFGMVLLRPLYGASSLYSSLKGIQGPNLRLQHFFSLPTQEPPSHNGDMMLEKHIELHKVNFAYQADTPIFQDCSLTIQAHSVTAILGANGSGKSTLARLLTGLLTPDAGHIRYDGRSLESLNLNDLRQHIGYVPQQSQLGNASIRDNICQYRDDVSDEQLIRVCKQALAHDFIMQLPDAYDTLIGDHGLRLSGGQAQRIALARALVHNPDILILDEPTAMFDNQSEQDLVTQLRPALQNKTVLLITHRPATLELAHHSFRLEQGQAIRLSS